jgi:hypothetical protein
MKTVCRPAVDPGFRRDDIDRGTEAFAKEQS